MRKSMREWAEQAQPGEELVYSTPGLRVIKGPDSDRYIPYQSEYEKHAMREALDLYHEKHVLLFQRRVEIPYREGRTGIAYLMVKVSAKPMQLWGPDASPWG